MLPGNDMLDVQWRKRRIFLVELTVFAPIASSLLDKNLRDFGYHLCRCPEKLAGLSLEDGNELIRSDIALIFRAFRG